MESEVRKVKRQEKGVKCREGKGKKKWRDICSKEEGERKYL